MPINRCGANRQDEYIQVSFGEASDYNHWKWYADGGLCSWERLEFSIATSAYCKLGTIMQRTFH